jgi:hypothetical protein
MPKRLFVRLVVAAAALAAPLLFTLGSATAAHASTNAVLTLSNGSYGTWAASGSSYGPGRSDVQIWVQDVTGGGWSTLEYQNGITTSTFSWWCNGWYCYARLGGLLSARGALGYSSYGLLGYYALHPLQCDHKYQAVTYDPADGWIYSNVLSEAACQVVN